MRVPACAYYYVDPGLHTLHINTLLFSKPHLPGADHLHFDIIPKSAREATGGWQAGRHSGRSAQTSRALCARVSGSCSLKTLVPAKVTCLANTVKREGVYVYTVYRVVPG